MHVGDLDGVAAGNGRNWEMTVTITVHDQNHNPVANATVNGTWSNAANVNGSCTTNANGMCSLLSGTAAPGSRSITFTVDSISRASMTYWAASNHDPDGDSDGTRITVRRP